MTTLAARPTSTTLRYSPAIVDTAIADGFVPSGYEPLAPPIHGKRTEVLKVRAIGSADVYALKSLRADVQDELPARRALEAEALIGRHCRSPFVIQVIAANLAGEQPYLIEEWLDGVTLRQRLDETGRLPVLQALWIARQCAQGLGDLQRAGFGHGNVSPANIFVLQTGEVKLIGLDGARSLKTAPPEHPTTGTIEYLAPETGLRNTESAESHVSGDIYSLGVTLFEMLTGRVPFRAGTREEALRMHREAKPPALRHVCPEAPRELGELVNRLLAKQPLRRPATFDELTSELIRLELLLLPFATDVDDR